jgi:hypothetical protein
LLVAIAGTTLSSSVSIFIGQPFLVMAIAGATLSSSVSIFIGSAVL